MAEAFKYIYNAMIGVSDNYNEREASDYLVNAYTSSILVYNYNEREASDYIYTLFFKVCTTALIGVLSARDTVQPIEVWSQGGASLLAVSTSASDKRQTRSSQSNDPDLMSASQPTQPSEFKCDICEKVFTTSRGLNGHKGRMHKASTTLPV